MLYSFCSSTIFWSYSIPRGEGVSTQTLTRTVTVTIDRRKTPCLPLEQNLGTGIRAIFILLFLFGGQATRGEYQAVATFAGIAGYSSFLAFALYLKLLASNSLEDVASSFKTVLMFAIPMATITMIMSESLLTILNVFHRTHPHPRAHSNFPLTSDHA